METRTPLSPPCVLLACLRQTPRLVPAGIGAKVLLVIQSPSAEFFCFAFYLRVKLLYREI